MRRLLLALALLAAAPGLWGCGGKEAEDATAGFPVSLSPVLAMDLTEQIGATGQLLAKERAEIAAEVGGRITEIVVDEGAAVEAGAVVLSIDPERRSLERDSAAAALDQARANLKEQERETARVRELHQRKVASATQLDQAETQLKLARSRLTAAEAQLGLLDRAVRDSSVTAPFAGFVGQRFVSRGEYVQAGQKLFELVSLDPVEVEFSVAEVDSSRVAVGQTVDVRVAPFPDETFVATVTFVSPTIEPRTRTLRVKAQLENREGRLRPGLFARVDLGVSSRSGVPMVLEEAILQRSDGAVVFRADAERHVKRVRIETGLHRDGYVEVVKGLSAGDLIVSRGQTWLKDGQLVAPHNADGSPADEPLPRISEAAAGTP